MSNHNIGHLNNNWKAGHRRNEPVSEPLSEREQLLIRIEVLCDALKSGGIPEKFHETRQRFEKQLADAQKKLADLDKPLTRGDFDLDKIVSKDLDTSFNNFMGPIEPPDDYRIYNCKQADGTYPPLSKFFEDAVAKADAGKQEIDMEPLDLGTHFTVTGGEVAEFGSPEWFEGIEPIEF